MNRNNVEEYFEGEQLHRRNLEKNRESEARRSHAHGGSMNQLLRGGYG